MAIGIPIELHEDAIFVSDLVRGIPGSREFRRRCGRSDGPNIIVASGGFKITLGIAHKMADAVLDLVAGMPCKLPRSFAVEEHVNKTK